MPDIGGVLAVAVLAFSLVVTQAITGGDTAQAASPTSFVPGMGDASAEAISVVPALSGYNLGVESGVSIANYLGTQGQGEAQMLTSALISALGLPTPASLSGLEAESSSTPSTKSAAVSGSNGDGVGTLAVSAAQSAGLASANLASFNLPGVLDITGGHSTAATSIINGTTRNAQSASSIGSISILGGLIVLNGLAWSANQSTGAQSTQSGTFSIGSVSVGSTAIAIPASGLTSVIELINTALAKTGLHLGLPTKIIGSDGSVQETPLTIGLDNSALGKQLVSPFVPQLQPLRSILNSTLVKIDPTLGESDLVLEIALSVLAGQGSLDLNLGGAYATTNGTAYANPLANALPSPASVTSPDLPDSSLGADTLPSLGGSLPSSASGSPAGGASDTPGTSAPTRIALKRLGSSTSCQSTSVGSCRTPKSAVIVIALVALTLGLLGMESLRMRRRKRLLLPEES